MDGVLAPKTEAGRVELKSACRKIQTALEDKLATTLGVKNPNARSTIAGIARRIELVAEAEKKRRRRRRGSRHRFSRPPWAPWAWGGRGGAKMQSCKLTTHGFALFFK